MYRVTMDGDRKNREAVFQRSSFRFLFFQEKEEDIPLYNKKYYSQNTPRARCRQK